MTGQQEYKAGRRFPWTFLAITKQPTQEIWIAFAHWTKEKRPLQEQHSLGTNRKIVTTADTNEEILDGTVKPSRAETVNKFFEIFRSSRKLLNQTICGTLKNWVKPSIFYQKAKVLDYATCKTKKSHLWADASCTRGRVYNLYPPHQLTLRSAVMASTRPIIADRPGDVSTGGYK